MKKDGKHKVIVEILDRESPVTLLKKAVLSKLCHEQCILCVLSGDSHWIDQVGIFFYNEDFKDEVLVDSDYIVPNRAKNIFAKVLVPTNQRTSHRDKKYLLIKTDYLELGLPNVIFSWFICFKKAFLKR